MQEIKTLPSGYSVASSITTSAPKTATASIAQVTALKTIPVSSISGPTHTSLSINYQQQPVTLAFIKPAEPGQLLTNLLLKQSRLNVEVEKPTSSPTTSSVPELHYVTVRGNQLHNIYVPTQQGFHIPVSGG